MRVDKVLMLFAGIRTLEASVCSEEQFNDLGNAYLAGQQDMVAHNISATDRLAEYNHVYETLTDAQKEYPCLECFKNYTSNLYDVIMGDACSNYPFGDECSIEKHDVMQEFADCAVSGSSLPTNGWLMLAIIALLAMLTN